MQTIDAILSAGNLTQACRQVTHNKGAAGVDAMSVKELKPYLDKNRNELTELIRKGEYYPQAIRGKEIPKSNKKKRLLGIPTVVDRMLQQAVVRIITTFKTKLKEITRKTSPMSFDQRMQKLTEVQRDWINYFKFASIYNKLNELDGWLRNRIRYCIWSASRRRRSRNESGKT